MTKKYSFKLERAYRHSYSAEFGRPIDEQHPDNYVIAYHVVMNVNNTLCVPYDLNVEFYSRGGSNGKHYAVQPFSDRMDKIFNEEKIEFDFTSLKETKDIIERVVTRLLALN